MNKKENLFEDLFNAFSRAASDAEDSESVTDNGIDLSKLQVNEEVFVSSNGIVWHKAYYAGHIGKTVLTFPKGQNAENYNGDNYYEFKHIELIKHEELKPCPFCGGKAEYKEYIGKYFQKYSVDCKCGACRCGDSKEDAIKLWNRRA